MNDKDLERLLSGRIRADDEASELALFLRDFDEAFPEPSIDHCEANHLTGIFAAAQQMAEAAEPVPARARPGPRPPRRFPRWVGVKLAVPLAAILLAFGGVALAGGWAYHEASQPDNPPETTAPVSSDIVPDRSGGDEADETPIDPDHQAGVVRPDGTSIEEHAQAEQGATDTTFTEEDDPGDQEGATRDDVGVGEEDAQGEEEDGDDPAIGDDDQDETDVTSAGDNSGDDQHVNEDEGLDSQINIESDDENQRGRIISGELSDTRDPEPNEGGRK